MGEFGVTAARAKRRDAWKRRLMRVAARQEMRKRSALCLPRGSSAPAIIPPYTTREREEETDASVGPSKGRADQVPLSELAPWPGRRRNTAPHSGVERHDASIAAQQTATPKRFSAKDVRQGGHVGHGRLHRATAALKRTTPAAPSPWITDDTPAHMPFERRAPACAQCRADRSIAAPLISGDIDAHLGTAAHATVVAVQVSAARCRCRRCGLA